MESFESTNVHWIDISLIFAYLIGISAFGYYFHKKIKTSSDYFLAGRSLPWWVIAMSIVGTNIGSNDYVGAAGNAYRIGIAQANFEWIGAIPAMIISALIFIPFYWRAGVFSIPEYLGKRYNAPVRFISAVVLTIFSVVIVGVFHWSTALMLKTYLGWPIWFSILITAGVSGFYTITGGTEAVAYTDMVQVGLMFFGAICVAVIGIDRAGGLETFITTVQAKFPGHLRAFLPADHSSFPWPGVILGLSIVLSPAYWCANQAILQRTMAARSEWDARGSMVFAALAKTLVPFLIVLPGFFALVMAGGTLERSDQALPWVVRNLLPPGISGIMFVAFIAALQSSISSTLNSTSVMIVRDIIGVARGTQADDRTELKMGRIFTFLVLFVGVCSAPLTSMFEGIYIFVQYALSLFQGPIFALISLGILYRRGTSAAGLWSLVAGLAFAALLGFLGVNMLYIAFWSFFFSVCMILVVSRFTAQKSDEELMNLTYRRTVKL
jgi:solute:Na+ symporter, SSS family